MEGKRRDVCIIHFISLKNFYVQDKCNKQIIQEISTSLQCLDDELLTLVSLKPGDLVAAKYKSDGLWYRAKILNKKQNACTVQFIDRGNKELTSKIKKLPEKLCSYQPMAYHCMLDDVSNEEQIITTNTDVYDSIFKFMTSNNVILKFLNDAEPYVVKMKWDNRNIKIFLNNIISYGITFETYKTLKQFDQSGTKMEVKLIYTASINEFYVATEDSEEIKNKIDHELQYGTVWKQVTEFKFGEMVIGKSTIDNCWYRVRILKIHDKSKCTCHLIDYGTQVLCTDFYEAVGYLKSTPPNIKRCSLYMPNTKRKILLDTLSKSFIDEMAICEDQKKIISIKDTGEPWIVELVVDNLNIASVIGPKPVLVLQVNHVNAFKVQIDTQKRRAIISELNKIETLEMKKKPVLNHLYAFFYDQWCRVKLIKRFQGKMEVIMVDNGGQLLTNVHQLYILPKHMLHAKYLTMHCTLGLDEAHYSSNKLRELGKHNSKFMMLVLKHDPINGHLVQLLKDNNDVTSMIKINEE